MSPVEDLIGVEGQLARVAGRILGEQIDREHEDAGAERDQAGRRGQRPERPAEEATFQGLGGDQKRKR